MSNFRLFKAAFVLCALYFEGCDWFKNSNNNENQVTPGDEAEKVKTTAGTGTVAEKISTEDTLKVSELKVDVDTKINELIKELEITDSADATVLQAAGEEIKKKIDEAAAVGNVISTDDLDDIVTETISIAMESEDVDKLNIKLAVTTDSKGGVKGRPKKLQQHLGKPSVVKVVVTRDVLSKIGVNHKDPSRAEIVKLVTDTVGKVVDDFAKGKQFLGVKSARNKIASSVLNLIAEDLVKMHLGPVADPTVIATIKAELIARIAAVKMDDKKGLKNIFEKYLSPSAAAEPSSGTNPRAIEASLIDFIAGDIAKLHLGPKADAQAIALKKAEVITEFQAAKESRKPVLENYFSKNPMSFTVVATDDDKKKAVIKEKVLGEEALDSVIGNEDSMLSFIAEDIAKLHLGTKADQQAITSKKAEVIAEFRAAQASGELVMEKHFSKILMIV